MRSLCFAVIALAGCFQPAGSFDDMTSSIVLCTTAGCAASPCDPGCIYTAQTRGSCGGLTPIASADAERCPSFCGLLTFPNAAGCGIYRGDWPGCDACGARWGDASCVDLDPAVDYRSGGAICPSGIGCINGASVGDLACRPLIDFGAPDDLASPPDLVSSD